MHTDWRIAELTRPTQMITVGYLYTIPFHLLCSRVWFIYDRRRSIDIKHIALTPPSNQSKPQSPCRVYPSAELKQHLDNNP